MVREDGKSLFICGRPLSSDPRASRNGRMGGKVAFLFSSKGTLWEGWKARRILNPIPASFFWFFSSKQKETER